MSELDARSRYLPGSFRGFLAESRNSQTDPGAAETPRQIFTRVEVIWLPEPLWNPTFEVY